LKPRTLEIHRILGTYEDFNKIAGEQLISRAFSRGSITKPQKEFYWTEIEEPSPSVPMVSYPAWFGLLTLLTS